MSEPEQYFRIELRLDFYGSRDRASEMAQFAAHLLDLRPEFSVTSK